MKYNRLNEFFILLLFLLVGCSQESDYHNEDQNLKIENRSSDSFTKTPIYDIENQKVIEMQYKSIYDSEKYVTQHDIEEIIELMGDKPGYGWKIIEDARSFELEKFGTSRFGSVVQERINLTNSMMFDFDIKGGKFGHLCPEGQLPDGAFESFERFMARVTDDPYYIYGGTDCVEDSEYYTYWQYLYEFTVSEEVSESIKENNISNSVVTVLDGRSGSVNMDYHGVEICDFPYYPDGTQFGPWDLFLHLRSEFYKNPFDTDCDMDFELYPEFDDADWGGNPLGVIFEIEIIPNIESGDVVTSQDESLQISNINNGYNWIFSTIYGAESGYHPVSGNRMFGLREKANGCWEFYTTGVDRLTTWYHIMFGEDYPFESADAAWDCIIEQVSELVTTLGGEVGEVTSVHCRPDWQKIYESWSKFCEDPEAFDYKPPCNECF